MSSPKEVAVKPDPTAKVLIVDARGKSLLVKAERKPMGFGTP